MTMDLSGTFLTLPGTLMGTVAIKATMAINAILIPNVDLSNSNTLHFTLSLNKRRQVVIPIYSFDV